MPICLWIFLSSGWARYFLYRNWVFICDAAIAGRMMSLPGQPGHIMADKLPVMARWMPGTPYLNWTNIPTLPKLAAFEKFFKILKNNKEA